MTEVYDFIVVGSGPAGCVVATSLANSPSHPTVLLLEAGGSNDDRNLRVDGQRWLTFQKKDLNWGYKTTAQSSCNNREIDYSRGRGLGGSSAINFGVFTVGARGDYDEWARIVGDDAFRWEHMQGRLKRLEAFHSEIPPGTNAKYVNPESSHHGTDGPLHTGFATEWERDLPEILDIFEKADFPLNPDHNSGNPIGMSVLVNSAHGGLRSTAADLLNPRPVNLTVVVDSAVQRLVFHDKRAVGVVTKRNQYSASHEIVLCAGALDTPKILMHSGIGPAEQLEAFDIPILHSLPAVGRGLRDHLFVPLVYSRVNGSTDRAAFYGSQKTMDAALEEWEQDGSGPWAKFACELGAGFFKLERLVSSQDFRELPVEVQRYLLQETVPHYEVLTHFPVHWFIPDFPPDSLNYSCLLVFQTPKPEEKFLFSRQTRICL